jgi:hypothetical protein
MLATPKILFINCKGSYFLSIVNHMNQNKAENALLLYLAGYKLKYINLNIDTIKKTKADNPWGYQPINLIKSNGKFIQMPDNSFFLYLQATYRITVEKKLISTEADLLEHISFANNKDCFCICKIDEFFLRFSDKFYGVSHNAHSLLIKSINTNTQEIEIIDSEKIDIYTVTFAEIKEAFCKSIFPEKALYLIDCRNYINGYIDKEVLSERFNQSMPTSDYLLYLLDDMRIKSSIYNNREYFFRGYQFTIISKIVPVAIMREMVLEYYNTEIRYAAHNIAIAWQDLSNFMKYKIRREDYSIIPIQKKIHELYKLEQNLELKIATGGK